MVGRNELDSLLTGSPASKAREEVLAFDAMSRGRDESIVLFGAGGLGRRALAGCRAYGVEPLAFVDNSPERQGTIIDGVRVLAPEAAVREFGKVAVFVVTIWGANSPHRFAHSRDQLRALGCDVVVPFPPLFWKFPRATLPHYSQDLPHRVLEHATEIWRGFNLWEDDASRAEYVAQVRLRLSADFDGLPHPVEHWQYFPDDLYEWRANEWIIDGGAYDGDTIRSLVTLHGDRFAQLLAFEPDPQNYAKLETTVARLPPETRAKIQCRMTALGSQQGSLHLDSTGTASTVTSANAGARTVAVPSDTLDAILGDAVPTLLKLDIEGAEPDALLGARETIHAHAPILAICVYHRQDHLWSIPLMLREWRDDYAYFLRPHNEGGWDLVCYAVPRSRLLWKAP